MPQLLASLFLRHEPAPIDYNRAMVALTESSLICSDLLRAHPRERGTILATKAETTVPALFSQQTSTEAQRLQGESLSFTASLHPPNQSNQQYSILSLSDSSGAVVERISYTAYGQPTFTNAAGTTLSSSAKATRYSYTGREWDSSLGLQHFRARWLSGASGRFIANDPIGYNGSRWNLFEFCRGLVTKAIDPTGLESWMIGPTVGGVKYPWIPPGTHLPGHPHSAPLPSLPMSPEGYAKSVCFYECCHVRSLFTMNFGGTERAEEVGSWAQTQGETYANSYYDYQSQATQHSALRHCVASGLLASRFGCNCAQCLVDMRDVAQFFRRDQKWSDTQRALYNDREGRDCAGCRGKGRVGGPLFGFRSDDAIKKCCFFKVVSRKLYTNNPETGIPTPNFPTLFPDMTPLVDSIDRADVSKFPTWWYPNKQPTILW